MTKAEELREALGKVETSARRTVRVPRQVGGVTTTFTLALNQAARRAVCAAICDTLGITREMVERVREAVCEVTTGRERGCRVVKEVGCEDAADALTALLEVAGR